jgi:hypothetical protein
MAMPISIQVTPSLERYLRKNMRKCDGCDVVGLLSDMQELPSYYVCSPECAEELEGDRRSRINQYLVGRA